MSKVEFNRELSASFLCVKQSLNDKLLSSKELKIGLQCLGLSPSDDEVEKIFEEDITFQDYCSIAKSFPKYSEEYIYSLFSKCLPVHGGKIKMNDFVSAFGPLSKVPDNGNSTDANFSKDDSINLTSVISNISKITKELKEVSLMRYDKFVTNENNKNLADSFENLVNGLSMKMTLKGSFFIENDIIISHQYSFTVPFNGDYTLVMKQNMPSNKYISDALAFLFKEENGKRTYISHTKILSNTSFPVCKCNLQKGKYIIVPYSAGCFLKKDKNIGKEIKLIEKESSITLTNDFRNIIKDIFNQVDLDSNNLLSRQEFNLYNWRTSGDIVEDDEWDTVLENFEVDNGELSLSGFISLHQLEAEDCDGKTEDLWLALEAMGYTKNGSQERAAHFEISVYSSQPSNLTVSGLRSGGTLLENVFIQSVIDSVTPSYIAGNKDILVYKDINSYKGTIIIKNESNVNYVVRIDCSNSINCLSHRKSLNFLLEIAKFECVIGHHLFPKDNDIPFQIISKESIYS